MPALPEELLHFIAKYLAYIPDLPDCKLSQFQCKRVSPELLSLSVANRRLRRICLPFLFAYVTIKSVRHVKKLRAQCRAGSLFPQLIQTLCVDAFYLSEDRDEGYEILCQILPHLKRLQLADLTRFYPSMKLLESFLQCNSISTIVVNTLASLPQEFHQLNISKIALCHMNLEDPKYKDRKECFSRGMRLVSLGIIYVDWELECQRFNDLHELNLVMPHSPASFSWLPAFSSRHPHLNAIWLIDEAQVHFIHHTPHFISSFVEASRRHDLYLGFDIVRVGLNRISPGSQEWHVTAMTLTVKHYHSLTEVLSVVFSCFPKIQSLKLQFHPHFPPTYELGDIADIAAILRRFKLLRTLYLRNFCKKVHISEESWEPARKVENASRSKILTANSEPRIHWLASRIAQDIPLLEGIHIDEKVYNPEDRGWRGGLREDEGQWWLRG